MEKEVMAALIQARCLQLYYHHCHNLVDGPQFFSDHGFFGDSYTALEANYDQLVEYFVGTFGKEKFKTKEICDLMYEQFTGVEVEKLPLKKMFEMAITMEEGYQKYLTAADKKGTIGLKNMVGEMATESDIRLYKIKQRVNG